MTILGQRLLKGPVHSKVVLREGTATPFMILYYITAKRCVVFFFFSIRTVRTSRPFCSVRKTVMNRVTGKCGREDFGSTEGSQHVECHRSPDSWPRAPRKLNIDQSHKLANNEGDKEYSRK